MLRRGKQVVKVPGSDGHPRRQQDIMLRRGKQVVKAPGRDVHPRRATGIMLRRGKQVVKVPGSAVTPSPKTKKFPLHACDRWKEDITDTKVIYPPVP